MRLRFKIKTLMVAVLVAALFCALFVTLPKLVIAIGSLSLLSLGPMIGASWAGLRYRRGRIDPIAAGIAGGIVQAVLILAAGLVLAFLRACGLDHELLSLQLDAFGLLAGYMFTGLLAGVFVWFCLLVFSRPPPDDQRPEESL